MPHGKWLLIMEKIERERERALALPPEDDPWVQTEECAQTVREVAARLGDLLREFEGYELTKEQQRIRDATIRFVEGSLWVNDIPNRGPMDERIFICGIVLDATAAGFRRGVVTDYESTDPGLGYSVAYHGEWRGQATVYVYNRRQNIPDGPDSEIVRREFDRTTHEVLSYALSTTSSPSTEIKLVDRYGTWAPDSGRAEYLCGEFILSDEHGPRRTFLYLTGAAGNFVKIRATLRTNDASDPTARNFADAVASGFLVTNSTTQSMTNMATQSVAGPDQTTGMDVDMLPNSPEEELARLEAWLAMRLATAGAPPPWEGLAQGARLAGHPSAGHAPQTAARLARDQPENARYFNSTSAVLARLSARRDMRWQRYNAKYGPDWATRLLRAIPPWVEEDVPRNQQFVG